MRRSSDDQFPKKQLVTEQFRRETNQDGDPFFSHPSLRHVFEPGERLINSSKPAAAARAASANSEAKGGAASRKVACRRSKARPGHSKRPAASTPCLRNADAATHETERATQQGHRCTEIQCMRLLLISFDQFSQCPHEMCSAHRSFTRPVRNEIVALRCSQHAPPVTCVIKAIKLDRRWLAIPCLPRPARSLRSNR